MVTIRSLSFTAVVCIAFSISVYGSPSVCGDGICDTTEVGVCISDCGTCGDGTRDEFIEYCDDGNREIGDGCNELCVAECGANLACPNLGEVGDLECNDSTDNDDLSTCSPSCSIHHDCMQGEYCYYGKCIRDSNLPIYHCGKPGCTPGRWCIDEQSKKGTCAESKEYECANACNCGPAHACLNVPGEEGKRCIKDVDDPWFPGGEVLFPDVEIPEGEATYCGSDPECHAGQSAYANAGIKHLFWAFSVDSDKAFQYCAGDLCYSACDCNAGESCVNTREPICGNDLCEAGEPGAPDDPEACPEDCDCEDDDCLDPVNSPGIFCNELGGTCRSNAVAEAVYGWKSNELLPCCEKGCAQGQKCEQGWTQGGAYAAQRLVGTCGVASVCGNGNCEMGESAVNCSQDCGSCGDENCCSNCPYYSGLVATCGNGICESNADIPEDCLYNEEMEKFVVPCPKDCGDTDRDRDGTADQCDKCPDDEAKQLPGDCGCGVAEVDTDSDGTPDCIDACPNDEAKQLPGDCGCGVAEVDTDSDGTPDCVDSCPLDAQNDSDGDGICGDVDECPFDAQNDVDADGICGDIDPCPESTSSATVSIQGCDTKVQNQFVTEGCNITDHIDECAVAANNHGQFVSCVSKLKNALKKDGIVSGKEAAKFQRCAAKSDIP